MDIEKDIFNRAGLLLGEKVMHRIAEQKIILFGVGGVGSWCAESLIRSGVRHLTIVDSDRVCASNINRQLMATTKTIGSVKVDVLKERLLEINPSAEITALQKIYEPGNAEEFQIAEYDYIVDAIDSLSNKYHLLLNASQFKGRLFSSMGAALKIDPTAIKVAEFWNVRGCPLGAALRKKMKKEKMFPKHKFQCVYSEELLQNHGENAQKEPCGHFFECDADYHGDPTLQHHDWSSQKAKINGTTSHITAIFGFTLAGLIIQDVYKKVETK